MARERDVAACAEDGFSRRNGRSAFGEQLPKVFDRLVPQRAYPPFVPFTMQMHFGWRFKVQMFDTNVSCFLNARPRVVEKEQQRSIS